MLTSLVVVYKERVIYACLVNEKAYSKSLENKELWGLHPKTHKILLVKPRIVITGIKKEKEWYVAQAKNNPLQQKRTVQKNKPVKLPLVKQQKKTVHSYNNLDFLQTLFDIIVEKKKTLCKDSYTSYLFESGSDKIKKKLGEEAVEILLAKTKKNILSESADFLYHLLVFFAQHDISIRDCVKVLEQRHTTH